MTRLSRITGVVPFCSLAMALSCGGSEDAGSSEAAGSSAGPDGGSGKAGAPVVPDAGRGTGGSPGTGGLAAGDGAAGTRDPDGAAGVTGGGGADAGDAGTTGTRSIDVATFTDRLRGAWVGQMAGVTWGASTEFRYAGKPIPDNEVPQWTAGMINGGYDQDDIYVEMPFIDTLKTKGVGATWVDFGESFKKTTFPLWHANAQGRQNLQSGIPAPESGHYANNGHADDIDWQIEADFTGLVAPGMINPAIDIAWRAGHVVNYGDGVYGGVAMAAMHAASFFATDVGEIIEAGRRSVPLGTKYRAAIDDVVGWHDAGKTWDETWQLLQDKWGSGDRCPEMGSSSLDIDAKLNGAYVLMGLLYGGGDIELSMRLAMRGGQDSDCNPSSAGGILGGWLGLAKVPDKFKSALNATQRFSATSYTFDDAITTNIELARQIVLVIGGSTSGSGASERWTWPADGAILAPIVEQWPVTTNAAPVVTAQVPSQNGRAVTFDASATDADGVKGFQWHFGDLLRADGAHATHTYAAAGTYTVIAYATDGVGNTGYKTLTVTVP